VRIIITGGGTGGHIYPALAIAKGLQKKIPGVNILYVGTKKGLEADIVPKTGLPFRTVDVAGLSRPLTHRTLVSLFKAIKGSWEGFKIIGSFKPHVVVGTGGYVCGPLVMAAATRGVATLIHEQNAFPGLTNRILARFVTHICVTFEDSLSHFPKSKKISVTGLPVREEILCAQRVSGLKKLGLAENMLTVVITGGSQGARSLNYAMGEIYQRYREIKNVQFYHITGKSGYEESLAYYHNNGIDIMNNPQVKIVPYLYQMEDALAAADLIIGRAGASFLSEIMVRGIPSILVPYPYAAANHQEYNARAMEKRGAAKVILDRDLGEGKLLSVLGIIMNNAELRAKMGKAAREMGKVNALDDIIKIIVGISKNNQR
jgi:UDP-N-acetylglucosamine--N-acetylmuramyl-(pentapeptide) pyrophosphoryl-undecaprenol N-acetylglucosamine transferase